MKLVCFGDSITYGFPYGPDASWVKYTGEHLGLETVNAGENGDTSFDLLRRVQKDVILENPRYTFIMIGTNDADLGLDVTAYAQNVAKIVEMLEGASITTLIGLPIPSADSYLEKRLAPYRSFLTGFALQKGLSYLDFSPVMLDKNNRCRTEYYLDDVHPSADGYRAMGKLAVDFLKKVLRSSNGEIAP
ncbi:GDSL-type esterase/lipase family protein [Thermincola potens]|uniref:Lipolytic protein G-D-S-L family n=1 Tax=Thermincola potens (strain JR) TaxID=635013 RepID=D5XEK6_THEPJ|nr:GDSL-type esterase/lipase family protein [Thermincola potens]ADG82077.1 lipolytic protein G-D-S-L family [Thermincola potens JR]